MAKRVQVNLFGARGERSVEIVPKGGFPTRHIKVPSEAVPSIFSPVTPEMVAAEKEAAALLKPPAPEKAAPKRPVTPEAVLDVLQKMTQDANPRAVDPYWFIIDEVLFVATARCGIRANHATLLETLRDLYQKEIVDHKLNRFDQHMFKLAENSEEAEWLSDPEAQREYKECCESLDRQAEAWENSQLGEVYIKALNCPEPWE